MNKDELMQEFQRALKAPTSGSEGHLVLKILHEHMENVSSWEEFERCEYLANVLLNWPHDARQTIEKDLERNFQALVVIWQRDNQMRIDEQREMSWYDYIPEETEPDWEV